MWHWSQRGRGGPCMSLPFLTWSLPLAAFVQWLCNANKKSDIPAKRLYCFFSSLYSVLVSYEISLSLPRPADSVMRQRHPMGRTQNGRTLLWLMLSQWTALKEAGGVGTRHASEMQRH